MRMIKATVPSAILFAVSIALPAAMFSCSRAGVRLAYCPTMAPYARQIALDNKGVTLELHDSAAGALDSLRSGRADVVLIGRRAVAKELTPAITAMRLLDGYTLVGRVQRPVPADDLRTMRIHTALSENIVSNLLPESTNIVFHLSSGDALRSGVEEAVLVDWREADDRIGLVIPMRGDAKDGRFRAPILYYRDGLDRGLVGGMARSVRSVKDSAGSGGK